MTEPSLCTLHRHQVSVAVEAAPSIWWLGADQKR
jgi:hypothetical protein